MEGSGQNIHHFTLEGPATAEPATISSLFFLRKKPGKKTEWRRIKVQMNVGTESCPSWDHLNLILTAVQELVTMNEGFISDTVVEAIRTNLQVVDYKTFQGPPQDNE